MARYLPFAQSGIFPSFYMTTQVTIYFELDGEPYDFNLPANTQYNSQLELLAVIEAEFKSANASMVAEYVPETFKTKLGIDDSIQVTIKWDNSSTGYVAHRDYLHFSSDLSGSYTYTSDTIGFQNSIGLWDNNTFIDNSLYSVCKPCSNQYVVGSLSYSNNTGSITPYQSEGINVQIEFPTNTDKELGRLVFNGYGSYEGLKGDNVWLTYYPNVSDITTFVRYYPMGNPIKFNPKRIEKYVKARWILDLNLQRRYT